MLFRKEIEVSAQDLLKQIPGFENFFYKKSPFNLSLNVKIKRGRAEVFCYHNNKELILGVCMDNQLNFSYPFSTILNTNHQQVILDKLLNDNKKFYTFFHKNRKAPGGEKARLSGHIFEKELEKILNHPGSFRDKVVEDLLLSLKIDIKEALNWQFNFIKLGKTNFPAYGGKKCAAKADILVEMRNFKTNEKKFLGISVKKTDNRTQIHITSVKKFIELIKDIYNIEIPAIVQTALYKFCGVEGYTPSDLLSLAESKKLKQGERQRFLLNELTLEEQKRLLEWFNNYHGEVLELVLSRGALLEDKYFATHYLCYNGHYSEGQDITHVSLFNLKSLIKKAAKQPVSFSKEFGCICLGEGVQIQMKGSGRTRRDKTGLQFQKKSKT